MADEGDLADVRQAVADRRFRDLVKRARRLSQTPPEDTLRDGLAMIESAHSLEVRPQ